MIFCALSFCLPPTGDVLLQCLILNYLWVVLVNIFLVKILNYKVKCSMGFYFGIFLSIIGVIVACVGFDYTHVNFIKYFPKYYYCYCFALISALSWGYYTIYLKKYSNDIKDDHVFVSLIIAGIICVAISFCNNSFNNYINIKFGPKDALIYFYESIIVFCLSYYTWSISSKYGNMKLLMNCSLFAPVLSVIFTSVFYGLNLFSNVVYGSIILVVAVICCKYSIADGPEICHEIDSEIDPEICHEVSSEIDFNNENVDGGIV